MGNLRSATLVAGITICAAMASAEEKTAPDEKVKVALFADAGCTDAKSREAAFKVLSESADISVEKVTTETVRSPDFMDKFDVFILPGGTGSGEASAVGEEAGKEIARRVKQGKGLIGICAGGYYLAEGGSAASKALDIIKAENHDGEHWARGEGFVGVKVLGVPDSASSRTMWYENGPIFKPAQMEELPDYVPLVQYVTDMAADGAPKGQMAGRDAVIAAHYGEGRVVAFGPHPELSPGAKHWLENAVKWAAGNHDQGRQISVKTVLEH